MEVLKQEWTADDRQPLMGSLSSEKVQQQVEAEDPEEGSSQESPRPRAKYLLIAGVVLLYFLIPVPAVLSAANYLSASSSSALSSLLNSFSSSSLPCHFTHHSFHGHRRPTEDSSSHHAKGYKAIFGSQKNAFYAKGRPSLHAGPRDEAYNAKIEESFLKVPNNESCIAASRSYTGFQHVAGTPGGFEVAHLVKQQWEKLLGLPVTGRKTHVFDAGSKQSKRALLSKSDGGVRVWTDTYYVLLNHPTPFKDSKSFVKLLDEDGNVAYQAKLREDALDLDPTSKDGNENAPPFHGYSKAGSAEGQLVYAHSGTVEDFKRLKDNGVDLTGKIAIVRYGGNFRGLKVKAAQEAAAAACIIYSDPAEDGEVTADNGYAPYPEGPARQPSSLQRGSVQYLSKFPGDPTTPGEPSYKDSKRVNATSIPNIPSLPLSYEDAIPLLRSLNGQGPCFDDWKGGLGYQDVQYCSGPSVSKVSLNNDVNYDTMPIWNNYARIEGHIKDEVVIIGNHRDAWVYGAADPNSGTAAIHEVIKGYGELLKQGWKPLRTILFTSWDAEEYGLVGSTEFGEDYAEHASKVVAYINLDAASAGSYLSMRASPSLADLLRAVTVKAHAPKVLSDKELDIGPLGSGSDYTVFLQHLGIASSDMSYRGTRTDPVYHYHSIYDSEYWQERYGDPGFTRHVNIAKTIGLVGLRLSDSPLLPLNVSGYALELSGYLDKVKSTAEAANITEVDFSKIEKAIANVQAAAAHLDAEAKAVTSAMLDLINDMSGDKHGRKKKQKKLMEKLRSINKRKMGFERGFISEEGLPRREWYKHVGVAPGENLGYGSTTFPGVTEAITIAGSESLMRQELERLTGKLEAIAKTLQPPHGRRHH
ncbi:Zn-dependent exopeptidase [Cystobasidium minutum MCA 4210]|uniref:Zn-dependent exopeptidase n=1 Tax=Cystobasidium minutum MCA 4210 TaxID=1397322 RepID=UPI0034CE9F8C|eukprot:jgi/Rhomi1/193306/gm1.1520_g